MNPPQPISVQAELKEFDLARVPQIFKCPQCGDILWQIPGMFTQEGSPIFTCLFCRMNGVAVKYYHLVPKGLIGGAK
jgi:hypothetical protein